MSWFQYSDQKIRKYRKGIWLRIRAIPAPLLAHINSCIKINETLAWVVVQELRPHSQVLLEVWCRQAPIFKKQTTAERFTVFHTITDEDPNWICEGDLGRGLVKPTTKRKKKCQPKSP